MARLTWTQIRERRLFDNVGHLLAPLVTGLNEDGTAYQLPVSVPTDTPLPVSAPQASPVWTEAISSPQRALAAGKSGFAGSGRLTLSVAGNIRGTLTNTSGTEPLYITRLSGLATSTTWATILIGPTAGLPGTAARRANGNVMGTTMTGVELKVDTNTTTPLSGGTDSGVVIGVPGGANRFNIDFPLPIILAPGASLGVAIPFAGAADAAFSAYFYRPA